MWVYLSQRLVSRIRGFRTYLLALIMGSGGAMVVVFDTIDANVNWKAWLYEHTSYAGGIIVGFSLLFALLRYQTTRAIMAEVNPPEPPEEIADIMVPLPEDK